jgi:hypothetical protein
MSLLKKQAENLASDILHLIPTGMFNALLEKFSPTFPDMLFLIPIAFTDAIMGGFVGLVFGKYVSNKTKVYALIIISFAIFECVDLKFIPIFAP